MKGIAGFYYVYVEGGGLYECKAKGSFRSQGIKPLVGDQVRIQILSESEKKGNLEEILPRRSELIRPAVANVDQALLLFAAAKPKPNLPLLDRFLIMMEQQKLSTILCFNKVDLASQESVSFYKKVYEKCGCPVVFLSAKEQQGVEALKSLLKHHTTALAGPSGVGKSTLTNLLVPQAFMETGAISEKIERGKHTTRHSELFYMGEESYLFDTPGFSTLELFSMEKEELKGFFPEFQPYEGQCRFQGCIHDKEPDCRIKAAVDAGDIHPYRYDSYRNFYSELLEKEKRRYH